MAWLDDIDVLNNANSANADFSITSGFDSPTDNDSAATTPIYVEGNACGWMPLKKGVANGYNATSVITGTPTLTNRIVVGFLNYPFADLDAIPINSMYMRLSSSTGFTTNYLEWNAKSQLLSPENTPISGHTPIIGYEDAGTESGTFNGNCESVGWVATTGNNADGKQGGFDWFFVISYVGAHSATFNGSFFSGLYSEYFDNGGSGLPGQTSRPIGVLSQAGDFFLTNVSLQMGDGTSDTNNIVVTENSKTIFWNNLHVNHKLGLKVVDPASTHEARLTLNAPVWFWNDQPSTAEIIDGFANLSVCEITGGSFSRGGKIPFPAASNDKWVRGATFTDCQGGTASNGEFTDCVVSEDNVGITVTGDADFTGTQILDPSIGADASCLKWNGNYDPDGNLDNMVFSKGTNSHHAIEFGIASPLTMTLRNIDFQNFSGTNGQTNSALYVKRTTGTVTINLIGCTGNITYKTDGATVNLVTNPVTLSVYVQDANRSPIQNAQTSIYLLASPYTELMNEDTLVTGYATESYSGTTPVDVVVKVRKSDDLDDPRYRPYSAIQTITSGGLSLTVTLEENPFI